MDMNATNLFEKSRGDTGTDKLAHMVRGESPEGVELYDVLIRAIALTGL
jgi:hypothetical protein